MCDIQQVHDYIAGACDTLKAPLLHGLLKSITAIGFERGRMVTQAIFEFPLDTVKELYDGLPSDMRSEIEVSNFIDEQFRLVIDMMYASPSLTKLYEADWRVVAETKSNDTEPAHCEVDSVMMMSEEGITLHRQSQQTNEVYPIKSLTIPGQKKAWCACVVEKYTSSS